MRAHADDVTGDDISRTAAGSDVLCVDEPDFEFVFDLGVTLAPLRVAYAALDDISPNVK